MHVSPIYIYINVWWVLWDLINGQTENIMVIWSGRAETESAI